MILDVETAIVSRLQAHGVCEAVYTASELSAITERAQITPAVHVIYSGYSPTREVGRGAIQEVETRWTVVVAVRSARRDGPHEKADQIFDDVIAALAGWSPGEGRSPLRLTAAPAAEHRPGFSYYPVQFTTRETVRGTT